MTGVEMVVTIVWYSVKDGRLKWWPTYNETDKHTADLIGHIQTFVGSDVHKRAMDNRRSVR
jgi:hypothetical protein